MWSEGWFMHALMGIRHLMTSIYSVPYLCTVAKFSTSSWVMLYSGSVRRGSLMQSNRRPPWDSATCRSSWKINQHCKKAESKMLLGITYRYRVKMYFGNSKMTHASTDWANVHVFETQFRYEVKMSFLVKKCTYIGPMLNYRIRLGQLQKNITTNGKFWPGQQNDWIHLKNCQKMSNTPVLCFSINILHLVFMSLLAWKITELNFPYWIIFLSYYWYVHFS